MGTQMHEIHELLNDVCAKKGLILFYISGDGNESK